VHTIVFSQEAEKVRAFFADVLGLLPIYEPRHASPLSAKNGS
jgi:hypothetical protein